MTAGPWLWWLAAPFAWAVIIAAIARPLGRFCGLGERQRRRSP